MLECRRRRIAENQAPTFDHRIYERHSREPRREVGNDDRFEEVAKDKVNFAVTKFLRQIPNRRNCSEKAHTGSVVSKINGRSAQRFDGRPAPGGIIRSKTV